MTVLTDNSVPYLPRGVRLHWCDIRKGWFLLAPERALKMDQIAAAVLGVVDGARTLGTIVDKLATDYNAPKDRIAEDVGKLLQSLHERRMVEIKP